MGVNREKTVWVGVRLWAAQWNTRQEMRVQGNVMGMGLMGKGRKCEGQEHVWTRLKQLSDAGKEWEGAYIHPFWTASRKTWLHMCLQLSWIASFRWTHLNSDFLGWRIRIRRQGTNVSNCILRMSWWLNFLFFCHLVHGFEYLQFTILKM